VLDPRHRLTTSAGFSTTTRRGRRAATGSLVVHLSGPPQSVAAASPSAVGPQVGFVVGKAVGNAVTRNRVRRRLRHLVRERIPRLPSAATVVVRALPAAASTSYVGLGRDLDIALQRLAAVRQQVSGS